MKETGEDQESHGQTTSMSGWEILEGIGKRDRGRPRATWTDTIKLGWEILEGLVEGERDRGRPRITWTENIKEWMGNIGGNGGG